MFQFGILILLYSYKLAKLTKYLYPNDTADDGYHSLRVLVRTVYGNMIKCTVQLYEKLFLYVKYTLVVGKRVE